MTVGVAIFVKTPGLSAVKTRLAASIGSMRAEQFHLLAAKATASLVKQCKANRKNIQLYWAVAEAGVADDMWSDGEKIAQGDGGLGQRMCTVHQHLLQQHDAFLLLGADTPQIPLHELEKAIDSLQSNQPIAVIGKSSDGGFWLFGGNREFSHDTWSGVEYSRNDTADNFVDRVVGDCALHALGVLTDVDEFADFEKLSACSITELSLTHEQFELAKWMQHVMHDVEPQTEAGANL